MAAITGPQDLNERRDRSYPRVVKRARHNHYPVRKPSQHGVRHDALDQRPPARHRRRNGTSSNAA